MKLNETLKNKIRGDIVQILEALNSIAEKEKGKKT